MRAKFLRFSVAFAAAFGMQLGCILVWSFFWGDALTLIRVIYRPFSALSEPLVRHYFDSSEGDLGYHILGAVLVGVLVYSIAAGVLALLFGRTKSEKARANA